MHISKDLLEKIHALPIPKIIGVSGFGGSGKSSFAKVLGAAIGAPVVGVDSFQKDGAFDAVYRLWDIMDFPRLEREVLVPFLSGARTFTYGHFDWGKNVINKRYEIENNGLLVVEGVGLFRPEMMKYLTCTIWMDCPIEEATARGKKRDREEYHSPQDELWDGIWKENDTQYYEAYAPKEIADVVVDNTQ